MTDLVYRKFLRTGIDLAPVGLERRPGAAGYFCTPKGAHILGWAGVDGIHYCRIRGYGPMIFAVRPMNAPDYVVPIAEDFAVLLRLLLTCGDLSYLEQAGAWDAAAFDAQQAEFEPSDAQQAVLDAIRDQLHLTPMVQPWAYVHNLQAHFDGGAIRYPDEFYDLDMNPDAPPPEWRVYFDGGFYGHPARTRAGRAIPIGQTFEWGGRRWIVPAVYECSAGLVVDFCMQTDAAGDSFDFVADAIVNGRTLHWTHGTSTAIPPLSAEVCGDRWIADHYGLNHADGWIVTRQAFPWDGKKPAAIHSLRLQLRQEPVSVPGPQFTASAPGAVCTFRCPDGTECTLSAQSIAPQTLPDGAFGTDRIYPTHYVELQYTVAPEPSVPLTVVDCADSDQPMETQPPKYDYMPAASFAIIGGADGSTVLVVGDKAEKLHTACSSLHFDPVESVTWQVLLRVRQVADTTVTLIGKEQNP